MSATARLSLVASSHPLAPPERQRAHLQALAVLDGGAPADFERTLAASGCALRARTPRTLQINLGRLCNMTCQHCHVDAGPDRTELASDAVLDACVDLVRRTGIAAVDLTGGAPELHPRYRWLVGSVAQAGARVLTRCNLTVLLLPRCADLPGFLAQHGVEVVASLPHPRAPLTDAQRGDGTFERSIAALRLLNAAGYGAGDPRRRLTLMTNPAGRLLAQSGPSVEAHWKARLHREHGVVFDRLIALNNMPISRFLAALEADGHAGSYVQALVDAYNPAATAGLMCRDTLSVGWDGRLFDCDFNQMLDLPARDDRGPLRVDALDPARLADRPVATGRHCYGCTAGAGSSCGGATA